MFPFALEKTRRILSAVSSLRFSAACLWGPGQWGWVLWDMGAVAQGSSSAGLCLSSIVPGLSQTRQAEGRQWKCHKSGHL